MNALTDRPARAALRDFGRQILETCGSHDRPRRVAIHAWKRGAKRLISGSHGTPFDHLKHLSPTAADRSRLYLISRHSIFQHSSTNFDRELGHGPEPPRF
jgi:hypothetical protein